MRLEPFLIVVALPLLVLVIPLEVASFGIVVVIICRACGGGT